MMKTFLSYWLPLQIDVSTINFFLTLDGNSLKIVAMAEWLRNALLRGEQDSFEATSWPHFLSFWNRFYPSKLVLAKPAKNICNWYYIFANQHKYSGSLQTVKTKAELEGTTEQEIEKMQADEAKICKGAKYIEIWNITAHV